MKALEELVWELCTERGCTLALAESCTGGALSARLTSIAGASSYFLGSAVTYSNEAKKRLLSIDEELLSRHGAVSALVVCQMAERAQKLFSSDYAVATSGIAGPSAGSLTQPVGTVHSAIARRGGITHSFVDHFLGTRSSVIEQSCNKILERLITQLLAEG